MQARAVDTSTIETSVAEEAVRHIALNLRDADREELRASHGGDPVEVLISSWQHSTRSWFVLDRTGLPVAVFGVAPGYAPGVGIVWLMGTSGLEREAFALARQTVSYVEQMHEAYPVLWNYIDARNELALRWLGWAGFSLVDADPEHGPERRLFFEFTRTP